MSDVMLFGVLRMPYEMAMGSELSRRQFYARAQEAVDRLEAVERDAARYREQMSNHYIRNPHQLIDMVRYANQFRPDWWMDKESWDAGIDFAIAAATQEGEG